MATKGCDLDRCKAVDLGFIHDSLKLRHKNVKKCEPHMATAMLIRVEETLCCTLYRTLRRKTYEITHEIQQFAGHRGV